MNSNKNLTSTSTSTSRRVFFWHNTLKASPPLVYGGLLLLLWSIVTLCLNFTDPRVFQGVSVWHKPWKFQLSTAVYWFSIAFFLGLMPHFHKKSFARRYIILVSITTGLFEVLYISWQGAMGLASHFNTSTAFYGHMYTAMGVGAVLLTSTAGVLGYQILRNKTQGIFNNIATRHSIGYGLLISCLLGTLTGGVMGSRTGTQGGHWVGGTANDGM